MSRAFYLRRWWIVVAAGLVILLVWTLVLSRSNEPVYQGRRLGSWLRGHPSEYRPAVAAVGTNALPYLLAESQATDSGLSVWAEEILGKASIGPFWRTASTRRYHAGLGLQILDSNASPALIDRIFAQPMKMVEGDPGYSAANSLRWLGSPASHAQVKERLARALSSPDAAERRNGCLALSFWPHPELGASLVQLSRDTNAPVRAAAVRAILFAAWKQDLFLPALVLRLDDEQAAIRRLAAEALGHQTTNAVPALPALLAAHAAEPTRPDLRSDLDVGYYDESAYTMQATKDAIESAIRNIDPKATIPRQ